MIDLSLSEYLENIDLYYDDSDTSLCEIFERSLDDYYDIIERYENEQDLSAFPLD